MLKNLNIYFGFLLVVLCFSGDALACDCAKISSVKANMHTFQTMVETYRVDYGRFPADVKTLKHAATSGPNRYWKEFPNPSTGAQGLDKAYSDYRFYKAGFQENIYFWGLRVYLKPVQSGSYRGLVLYQSLPANHYAIYGVDNRGALLKDNGKTFVLNND